MISVPSGASGKIYLLGGIGCGKNIFGRMSWPEGSEVRFIEWKEVRRGEDFSRYCVRLASGIKFGENDVLLGVSLGGVAALEIASANSCVKAVVLVSSPVNASEYSRTLSFFTKCVPAWSLPLGLLENVRVKSFLVTGSAAGKYARQASRFFVPLGKRYYKTAVAAIRRLDGTLVEKVSASGCRVERIHGMEDTLFPAERLSTPALMVDGGTHLMVYVKAGEVSSVLEKVLEGKETLIPSDGSLSLSSPDRR